MWLLLDDWGSIGSEQFVQDLPVFGEVLQFSRLFERTHEILGFFLGILSGVGLDVLEQSDELGIYFPGLVVSWEIDCLLSLFQLCEEGVGDGVVGFENAFQWFFINRRSGPLDV